jgi:hypothetical protein
VTSTANSGIPQEHASCADLTERLPLSIAHRQTHYRWNLSHRTLSVLYRQSNCSVEWHTEERKHERLQLHTACAELTEQNAPSAWHTGSASSQELVLYASPRELALSQHDTQNTLLGWSPEQHVCAGSSKHKLLEMAHRHVTAHRSTLPVLVQQSKCSLEWHTGKCGLTETRPCADPTEQKLIGMAHREHASGESLQKPLPVLVQQSICFLARHTGRRLDAKTHKRNFSVLVHHSRCCMEWHTESGLCLEEPQSCCGCRR